MTDEHNPDAPVSPETKVEFRDPDLHARFGFGPNRSVSRDQAEQMSAELLKAGVDPKRVQAAAASHGFDFTEERSPEQVEHDDSFGMHFDAHKYDFERALPPSAYDSADKLADIPSFTGHAADLFSAIGAPPELASGLIKTAFDNSERFKAMSEEQQQAFLRRNEAAIADLIPDPAERKQVQDDIRELLSGFEGNPVAQGLLRMLGDPTVLINLRTWLRHADRWHESRPGGSK